MLPSTGPAVLREYVDADGQSPFARWFNGLDAPAAAKVAVSLYRLERGNFSNVEGVGSGVQELKIHFGPGYRVYFGMEDGSLVILLGGGSKKRQARDIATAQQRWRDYKGRKP